MKKTAPPKLDPDVLLKGNAVSAVGDFFASVEDWAKPYLDEFDDSEVQSAFKELEQAWEQLGTLASRSQEVGNVSLPPCPPLKELFDLQASQASDRISYDHSAYRKWLDDIQVDQMMSRYAEQSFDNLLYEFCEEHSSLDLGPLDKVDWDELEKALS